MAGEIARNLAELSLLPVPVVYSPARIRLRWRGVALLPSDVLIAASDAWIRTVATGGPRPSCIERPPRRRGWPEQRITAVELASLGVVDALVSPLAAVGRLASSAPALMRWRARSVAARASAHPDRIDRFSRAVGPSVVPGSPQVGARVTIDDPGAAERHPTGSVDRFRDMVVPDSGFGDDDGSAPVELAAALAGHPPETAAVVAGFAGERLLVALVAVLGRSIRSARRRTAIWPPR